jgi:HK97 gp10 family phage protein
MAKIEFDGFEEYRKQLLKLGTSIEGVIKYAVYDAAGMVADSIKANAPADTGALRNSIGLTDFKNDGGYVYTQVVFSGYDGRGVPNVLKARVLESGSSTRAKHPFVRPAVNRVKSAAEYSIEMKLDEKMNELMKGS